MARQQCLIRCRHCRIFFLTHRRNHRRLHLASCPFGCRQEHDRRESIRRTAAYYREHPEKKRALNQRRYRLVSGPVSSRSGSAEPGEHPRAASSEMAAGHAPVAQETTAGTPAEQLPPRAAPSSSPQCPPELVEVLPKAQDPEVMGHVRIIVSLLEARPVSLEEIWQTLLHFWRQRTLGRRRPIDHTVAWLNSHPP